MPFHPFSAAIFDFDETIIDLERQHTAAYEALCRDFGARYEDMPESFRNASGKRVIDDVREMRAHFGWTQPLDELFALRQRHFDAICASARLETMPGVRETIALLRSRHVPLAIASSAVRASIEQILERLELRDAFDVIVEGAEVEHGKPDPEAYLVTARKLGVEPAACLVFEDSHVGVVAAKRAGMQCVAVRNPHALQHQDLSEADVVASSMTEVLPMLEQELSARR